MFNNRIRGIAQIHILLVSIVTVAWLFGCAQLSNYLGWFALLNNIHYFQYVLCLIVGVIFSMQALGEVKMHLLDLSIRDNLRLSVTQVGSSAIMMFSLTYLLHTQEMSRLFLGTYLLSLIPILFLVNKIVPTYLSKALYSTLPKIPTLLMVPDASMLGVDQLLKQQHLGFLYIGILSPIAPENPPIPLLGSIESYVSIIEKYSIQQVILTNIQKFPSQHLEEVILTCQQLGCRVLMQDLFTVTTKIPLTLIREGDISFYSPLNEPLEEPLHRLQKRALDLLVAVPIVLFVLPPLMLVVKIVQMRQAPGDLFKLQPRGGRDNKPFIVYKFRSMRQDMGGMMVGEATQATKTDPRIYPFGGWMRRTSVDELPQLINVLLGNMSIIGPRPHLVAHDLSFSKQYRPYRVRQYIKPGVTGWAQIHGFRGEISDPELLEKRIQHDLYYIHNWSPFLDIEILFRTVKAVLVPPSSAY